MSFRFSIPIALVPSDCNGGKHVDHLRFYAFFEQARFAYLRSLHHHDILEREKCTYMVKRTDIVYENEVFLDDTVTVNVWPARLGNSSVDLRYEVRSNDAKTACTGVTTLVFTNPESRKSRPIPADLRAAFASVMPQ